MLYCRSQYNYEHQILHQCPFPHDEVPAESVRSKGVHASSDNLCEISNAICVQQIVAHAASIHLSTDLDPRTHAVVPPNYALVGREAADAIALKLLKRVNWCRSVLLNGAGAACQRCLVCVVYLIVDMLDRFRVCFIGQREAGCVLALLNPEAMRLVLSQLLLDD